MEAQINQTSLQNAAQREMVALFNHFYEKLAFFLIRVVHQKTKNKNKNKTNLLDLRGIFLVEEFLEFVLEICLVRGGCG